MRRFFGKGSAGDSPQQASTSSSSEPPSPLSAYSSSPEPNAAAAASVAAGKAIPFVTCDANGKFQMSSEAVAMLQLVKGPIGVVAVCGRARQGKSFILNQLLGRSSGFQVASTQKPCTKGIWLWSAPVKRTALDGTEYNLLLLDTEGIDAYDQTGTYSTQIFSLAVLLSTMFIYNQMGGIDEAALDRLSLVTEMTKHIRVRASGGRNTASELGQFAPIFVWLLRDFYLDLIEDNRKITPRDYLEIALSPVQGGGKAVAAKNEIRESIRALFPDRECFTLVRPLSNEKDLRNLDHIPLENLRPEFRAGLDALTRFVFERTRPKQVGGTVMTGPLLARITQSFLDALNNGAVPTITSSWQSVEESECQRAYDQATELYMASFNRPKAPEESVLREAHEDAVQKSLAVFNSIAVGTGSTRQKYEKRLQTFLKKAFEDIKRDAFREAYLLCTNTINHMEKELRSACNTPNAKVDHVIKVLDGLITKYESECHGPEKWKKLAAFLRQSLEGPVHDLVKKQIDQVGSERSTLALKCRGIEDMMNLRNKQLEAAEQQKSEYLKRYEDAINDKKKISEEYMSRISNLQSKCSSLEEKYSSISRNLDSSKHESLEFKRKYEQLLTKLKSEEDQFSSEISLHKSRIAAAEARLSAAREHAQSAEEEAEEWKRKYDIAVREAKTALEKAAVVQERSNKQTQEREDALREEFSATFAEKEEELKAKALRLEQAEQRLTTLNLELKAAESKIRNYDSQIYGLKSEIKELGEKLQSSKASAQSFENKARILEQEKLHLEQRYESEFSRFAEVQQRCKSAEETAKRATDVADVARAEAATAQREKNEFQRMAMEGKTELERAKRDMEKLERQTRDLHTELQKSRNAQNDALSKVVALESRVEEREKEIETLLQSNNEQRSSTLHVLEQLLENEREARAKAVKEAHDLSKQLQSVQTQLDEAQRQVTAIKFNETALDGKLRTASHGKRVRADDYETGMDSFHDMDMNTNTTNEHNPQTIRTSKRTKSTTSPSNMMSTEDGGSVYKGEEEDDTISQQTSTEDYTRFTVQRLKQELTKHNFGGEVLKLKNPIKKDTLVALYEKFILKKS